MEKVTQPLAHVRSNTAIIRNLKIDLMFDSVREISLTLNLNVTFFCQFISLPFNDSKFLGIILTCLIKIDIGTQIIFKSTILNDKIQLQYLLFLLFPQFGKQPCQDSGLLLR